VISLYDTAGARLLLTFNSLNLNSPSDAADDGIEVNDWAVRQNVDFAQEPNQNTDGLEAYDPRKQGTVLLLSGRALAPTQSRLMDRLKLMASTFDPVLVARNNPTVNGFLPLDFSTLTNDTANYATGKVPARYYVRPRVPLALISPQGKDAMVWKAELLLRDSRRYLQSTSSANISASTSCDNTKADYPSWPTITLNATGAGAAALAISRTGSGLVNFVINISGLVNGDVVVIDMEKRNITKNGVTTMSLYVSGDWFDLNPGSNTVVFSDTTNYTGTVVWRPAFAL